MTMEQKAPRLSSGSLVAGGLCMAFAAANVVGDLAFQPVRERARNPDGFGYFSVFTLYFPNVQIPACATDITTARDACSPFS